VHVPDGFLDAPTALAAGVLSAVGLGLALRRVRRAFPPRRVPLIGLAAAFVFAAQMLNFPVAGGTSGHLIGATLAAALLGPSAAVLVMSSVVILQCFMFADGGVTALGANLFNMAVVAPAVGYGVYQAARRFAGAGLRGRLVAAGFGAWCSTVAAAVACAGQLALSGTVAWRAAFPAMAGVHMLIGLGEAVITILIVAAVARARPELLEEPDRLARDRGPGEAVALGLLLALGLVVFVAPFASPWPDGLQRVAGSLGFAPRASAPLVPAPLARYAVPGLTGAAATVLAGAVGALFAFGAAYVAARLLTPATARRAAAPAASGEGPDD
jgi:cobalt/nickel transport system permease protein